MKRALLRGVLLALPLVIRQAARKHETVRRQLRKENCVIQVRLRDGSLSRNLTFTDGRIRAGWGRHASPDAEMVFASVNTALAMLKPDPDYAVIIDALKNFKAAAAGSDRYLVWFGQLMHLIGTSGWVFGRKLPDGATRYTNLTNGGPIHVDVKAGHILRTMPIEFSEDDPPAWELQARGRTFTPTRTATVSPHALTMKSLVYSPRRILYPMKRVGFDPGGDRQTQQRGRAKYERISWDEALDIVAGEIRRMKREYGPGAIAIAQPAHHQWGNINYWLSALYRFGNLLGHTKVVFSPISWEGWYWGAAHHYGNNMRLGVPGFYGTVEDCLQNAGLIVFWSSDPESTNGIYAGAEGTQRRLWAKELGIEFVHIDPALNSTAQMLEGNGFRSVRAPTPRSRRPSCMNGSGQGATTSSMSQSGRLDSGNGRPICSVLRMERRRLPNGRSGRPAFRPVMSAASQPSGAAGKPISRPAGSVRDLEARAGLRPVRNGRAAW